MSQDFTVTITEPSRAAEWQAVFGTTTICVTTPLAQPCSLPGHPHTLAFFVDVPILTSEQRDSLITHLSIKFDVPKREIISEIERDPLHAIPILAEHCLVTVENPQRWL